MELLLPLNWASRRVALSGRPLQVWVLRTAANLWEALGRRPLGHFPWELDLPGGKYLVAFLCCVGHTVVGDGAF